MDGMKSNLSKAKKNVISISKWIIWKIHDFCTIKKFSIIQVKMMAA